jgi:hypothetical protein
VVRNLRTALHLPRRCNAPLDGRASSEATWPHLVLRRELRPAVASDRDQQGIHNILRRSQARALDRLAEVLTTFSFDRGHLVLPLACLSRYTETRHDLLTYRQALDVPHSSLRLPLPCRRGVTTDWHMQSVRAYEDHAAPP